MQQETVVTTIQNAKKVLFVLPMALGDFAYLHLVIREFCAMYPQIKADVLFDEAFHGNRFHRGSGVLVNPIICQWAEGLGLFRHVYTEMYSGGTLEDTIAHARAEQYDAVISFASRGRLETTRYCRIIAGEGLVISWDLAARWWKLGRDRRAFDRLVDFAVPENPKRFPRIIQNYNFFFSTIAAMPVMNWEEKATMAVPAAATSQLAAVLAQEGIDETRCVVFVNPFAKNRKRSWPLPKVGSCIRALQQREQYAEAEFFVNGLPSDQESIRQMIAAEGLTHVQPFTARDDFWELPAMLQRSDLIITVETSVMHLAALLHKPQVVLMRLKNPEWTPLVTEGCRLVLNAKRSQHIADIEVDEVLATVAE